MDKYPAPWANVAREYRAMLRSLPHEVSVLATNDFRENFRRQGYINRGGVLIPWRKRARRGTGSNATRAVLVKTGMLLRGIRPSAQSMAARVINSVPYASAHNDGFKGTVKVRKHLRNIMDVARTTQTDSRGRKKVREEKKVKRTVWVTGHSRKVNLPRRPFMVSSPVLDKMIDRHIDKRIETIWQRA